jgi:hypothetical protein
MSLFKHAVSAVFLLAAAHASDVQGRSILLFDGTWFNERNQWFEFKLEPGSTEVFVNR